MFGRRVVVALAVVWVALWVWISRYHMLDDAMIHLRYAEMFARTHMFSFDGVVPSFGCSSPMYVALLAALSLITSSPLLPKVVSLVCYGLLMAWMARRAARRPEGGVDFGYLAFVIISMSPMAMRWLTDGMETSLVLLIVTGLAVLTLRQADKGGFPSIAQYVGLFAFGTALSVLRVDLAILAAIASLALVARRLENASAPLTLRAGIVECFAQSHFAVGTVAAFGVTWLMTGQVLPDTAIAKASVSQPFFRSAFDVLLSTLSSFSFGGGLLGLWLLTLAVALAKGGKQHRWSTIIGNLAMVITLILIARRGQKIQGIRHLVWHYWFTVIWNLEVLRAMGTELLPAWLRRPPRALLAAASVALVAVWAVESRYTYKVMVARAKTWTDMRDQHLDQLAGEPGVAYDIGFIGYFSNARITDMAGLVNGRDFAKLNREDRMRFAAQQHPAFLFLSSEQAAWLNPYLSTSDYVVWHKYAFPNVRGVQYRYLAVRQDLAARLGATGEQRLTASLQ